MAKAKRTTAEKEARKGRMTQRALERLMTRRAMSRSKLFGSKTKKSDNGWQLGILKRLIDGGYVARYGETVYDATYGLVPGQSVEHFLADPQQLDGLIWPSRKRHSFEAMVAEPTLYPLCEDSPDCVQPNGHEGECDVGHAPETKDVPPLAETQNDDYIASDDEASEGGEEEITDDDFRKGFFVWCEHLDERIDEIDRKLERITQWLKGLAE